MELTPTAHAGNRSFERDVTMSHVKHALTSGTATRQDNGTVKYEARDPQNQDHVIKVVVDPKTSTLVTAIRDTSRPMSGVLSATQQNTQGKAQEKATADKSKSNRKAQLKAKQERSRKARAA